MANVPIRLQKIFFFVFAILCLAPWISSPIALILGFSVALFIGNPFQQGIHKIISLLLQISIVGLGFSLQLDEALKVGQTGFVFTAVSIVSVLVLGFALGKLFHVEKPLAYLISVGTAICGGSAIAAVSPIIKPSTKQISVALAIVFSLNSIALFVFPFVGEWLQLSQEQFGLWCAIGIHDTSSVVGAASKFGDEALGVATTVKLARALWIIPISLLSMLLFKSKESSLKIPWFIGLFVLAILANTYLKLPYSVNLGISRMAKSGLCLTLFLIGSTLSVNALKNIGLKPLLLAVLLWCMIAIGSLAVIIYA